MRKRKSNLGQIIDNAELLNKDLYSLDEGRGAPRQAVVKPSGSPVVVEGENAATFNIKVEKLTNNISVPCPFILFGALHLINEYADIALPNGFTISAFSAPNETFIQMTVTNDGGITTDNIRITCDQIPITSFIQSLLSERMQVNYIRWQIPVDPASPGYVDIQANQTLVLYDRTIFGLERSNKVNPGDYKEPQQFQSGIIDLMISPPIDKQKYWIHYIVDHAGLVLTYTMFVKQFERY